MGIGVSLALLIIGIISKSDSAIIASGLFAIAGSLGIWLNQIAKAIREIKDKDKKN